MKTFSLQCTNGNGNTLIHCLVEMGDSAQYVMAELLDMNCSNTGKQLFDVSIVNHNGMYFVFFLSQMLL